MGAITNDPLQADHYALLLSIRGAVANRVGVHAIHAHFYAFYPACDAHVYERMDELGNLQ